METNSAKNVKVKFMQLGPSLNEKERRLWAASEAMAIGPKGVRIVAKETGLARSTIYRGIEELKNMSNGSESVPGRVRRPGAGRKRTVDKDPGLVADLDSLINPLTRGDPESPLRWTCKSLRKLAQELTNMGHIAGTHVVANHLKEMGYSLQANKKVKEGANHPDRDAQFNHINEKVKELQSRGEPVISVDTKKKENIGDFKNAGREYHPKGQPEEVRTHDFIDETLGKVNPYGIYDVSANEGLVNVGTDAGTAEFSVESISRWYWRMGHLRYPNATELLITADCGGSNGYRLRQWKLMLQKLADDTQLTIHVCHYPPGTSKWNKIEHRMFSFITMNWRGRPLVSHEVVVNCIRSTTTKTGLRIEASLDENEYQKGIRVSDAELASINIERSAFHGEWNYTIRPRE